MEGVQTVDLHEKVEAILIVIVLLIIMVHFLNWLNHKLTRSNTEVEGTQQLESCERQLHAMRILKYTPPTNNNTSAGGNCKLDESCSICLEEYEKGAEVRKLAPCKHIFHKECIDRWLITRSSFCPICRARVIKRRVEPNVLGRPYNLAANNMV